MEKVLTVKEWIQKKKLDEIAEYIRTSPEIKASYDSLARTARGYGISSRMKGEAVVDSVAGEIKVKVNPKEISQDYFISTYPDTKSIQEESISLKPTKQ